LASAESQDEIKQAYEDIVMPSDYEIRNLADAINAAIKGGAGEVKQVRVGMPEVVVQLPEIKQAPAPVVNVSMPEQPTPIINITMPEQPAPIINVAAPEVNITNEMPTVTAPPVTIHMPEPKPLRINRDASGAIESISRGK
jgi:predicted component of type VI protein secretion system